MYKDISTAFWVCSVVLSLILNVNLIGALIILDWNWILNNWLNGINGFLVPLFYFLVHFLFIITFKTAVKRINNF